MYKLCALAKMVCNEYGKRDSEIANNARMSNSVDPNLRPLFERVLCLRGVGINNKNKEDKIKHQPKIVFKTTLPKQKKIHFISNVFLA